MASFARQDMCRIHILHTVVLAQGESRLHSSTLFNIFLERIMTDALEDHKGTVNIGRRTITNLRFADDIDGLALMA